MFFHAAKTISYYLFLIYIYNYIFYYFGDSWLKKTKCLDININIVTEFIINFIKITKNKKIKKLNVIFVS